MANGLTEVLIPSGRTQLSGTFAPAGTGDALVLFAHGSGSSRHSPRNQAVAAKIREAGIGTLLFDLLTPEEEARDRLTGELRFDVHLLAGRLVDATKWAFESASRDLAIGYFGASTGAAAALIAAARLGDRIGAVVSRGGRPDLAGDALAHVVAPTLLIVGALDTVVIELNEQAYEQLTCEKEMVLVPAAGHLFEEPFALARVAALASDWFRRHLLGNAGAAESSAARVGTPP
jgi:pimeloyl-ACP methyl ester carboxylesterase